MKALSKNTRQRHVTGIQQVDSGFGHLVMVDNQRYDIDRQTAAAERIPPEALPHLLAAFYAGQPDAFDDLNRGFAYLCFQVAERVAQTIKRRLALLPVMCVDLGIALRRCKESRKPANEVTAYLARELSNSPKHADDPGFIILDSHKGKDRGKMVCRQSDMSGRPRDHRKGKVGDCRKPRGIDMDLTRDEARERERYKRGWYESYVERAQSALGLTLDRDQKQIVRLAADGNSPEEITRMLKLPPDYINTILNNLERWLRAADAERARRARCK